MAKDVTVRISHDLGALEAQRRIAAGLDGLRSKFGERLTSSDVAWRGSHADIRVGAMGQTLTGLLEVESDVVVVTVRLPWLLARMREKVGTFLQSQGSDLLRLAPPRKTP